MVEPGTIVADKYVLDRVIGHGGMGLVVQATHLRLHQPVALKILLPHAAQDPETVQRFVREARAAVQLRGEHVARVLDVGALDTGTPYMVLEYLDGIDLERFPRDQLTLEALVDLALQACEALAEAHALGIVHRDIKPSNFFITRDPGGALFLKLLDFGISKTPSPTSKLTESQVMLGTPPYMSPEQVRASSKVDPRSDLWSLGVVLYELIEGRLPFEADAFSAMILKIINDPPAKLTARIPAGLERIILRCLEKKPARRFQSTAELAAALAAYAGSPAQAAITVERTRALAPGRADADALYPHARPVSPPTARWRVRTRGWQGSLIAAIAVAVGVGAGFITVQDPAAPAAPPVIAPPSPVQTAPAAAPAASAAPALAPVRALAPATLSGEEGSDPAPATPPGAEASAPAPATPPGAEASAPAPATPPGAEARAEVTDPARSAATPGDRPSAAPAASSRPLEAPARRPHRSSPASGHRAPARTEETHDRPGQAAAPRRFDPGD